MAAAAAPVEECRNWANFGKCRFGENCRYTHGTPGTGVPARAAGDAPHRFPRRRGMSTQQCHQFKEGTCTYGENCRFRHGDADARPMPAQPVCFEFRDTGKCSRGAECRFSHTPGAAGAAAPAAAGGDAPARRTRRPRRSNICYNFRNTGKCDRGTECPFDHVAAEPAAADAAAPAGDDSAPRRRRRTGAPRPFTGTMPDECFEFKEKGTCSRGETCRFRHGKEDARPLKPKGVCFDFQKGQCTRTNCKFEHVAAAAAPAAAPAAAAAAAPAAAAPVAAKK